MISNPEFYLKWNAKFIRITQLEDYDYDEIQNTFRRLNNFFEEAGIQKHHIHKFSDAIIETVETEKSIKNDYPNDKSVLASFKKICKWTFDLNDILNTYGYISSYSKVVYFSFDYSEQELKKIYDYLNKYIDEFINHELIVSSRSFLVFEKQKEWFIKTFKEMQALEKFWNNFIITKKADTEGEVLFFHTLFALEKLEYVEVINIWFSKNEYGNRIYKANIIVSETFIKEINQEFQKENPKKYIEKFDSKTGVLTFAGKKIELSKSGKETDPVLLMKTLLKREEWEWVHNDEIFEDWGIREDEQVGKNKIYFALQKINSIMGRVVQIEDFIEWGTKKARINPKYRKSW